MIKGKKGIVIGIANDHSIAWGIAKQLHGSGAELAITYQNNTLLKRVKPLADKVNSDILVECDVNNEDHLQNTFTQIKKRFGTIDFIIHAVAYSDKNELNGRYIDTSKDNFINSLSISCYSFTRIAKIFQPILNPGGSLVTLSFHGASKVMPNYNVMGVAKAALETSVKYLSVDLGDQDVRVNAISAGPMRTIAGAAIANARDVFNYTSENSSLNVVYLHRGVEKKYLINRDFLSTPEAKSLNEFRKPLMENFGLLKNGSAGLLKQGDIEYKINGPVGLIERVVNIGKQGLQINRYKGLGEMNPDQLWETTLDNNYRSLLKVKLDEVDQANLVFETLMGDVTEGRKNFIQENSLKVANLDI